MEHLRRKSRREFGQREKGVDGVLDELGVEEVLECGEQSGVGLVWTNTEQEYQVKQRERVRSE